MKIVIDIPEDLYKKLKESPSCESCAGIKNCDLIDMIIDGMPMYAMEYIKSKIWDSGMNFGGQYQGVWIRYRDVERIIDKYISRKEKV